MAELAEGGSNGLSWGWDDGILLMNQHGWKRTVSFLVDDIDESTSSIDPDLVTVVNESFDGAPFNSPNDMIVAGDGNLYFTDPPYGLQYSTVDDPFGNSFELMTQDKPAVYRRTEEGDLERLLEYEVDSDWAKRSGPNGVARIDANGDLAVAITDFGNPRTEIYSPNELVLDGTFNPIPSATLLHEYRIEGEFDFFPALVDGITYDADIGVLFISGPGGIYIYDAAVGNSYDLLGFIRIDDLCSNNVVGGGYLWMTCNQRVLRIPLAVMDGVEAEDDDSSSGFHLALQQFFPVWLIGAVAFSLI
jgi:gluconolactonase